MNLYKNCFKRFFDFWISLIALICISPILIVVTIWLHFANKGAGAFFFQERPGKAGKIFKVIKFKTMTDERDADGNLFDFGVAGNDLLAPQKLVVLAGWAIPETKNLARVLL